MKLGVNLPDGDVGFLDRYAREHGLSSRSAALHEAIGVLRASVVGTDYRRAWQRWVGAGDEVAWQSATADVLSPG